MALKSGLLVAIHLLLFFQAIAAGPRDVATSVPIVHLGYSQYQGFVNTTTNTTSFLGVRYAAPPVGNLRWVAPQPPNVVSGVQLATEQPDKCFQAPAGRSATNPFITHSWFAKRGVGQSEDCLFLNVYIPGKTVIPVASGGLPVVVWIHGGGYVFGAASIYNGADLVVESDNGVIVVVIQYRLGLFGFLSGQAVKEGGVLNAGLLDQNYALQWVQSHIAKFGGDPTKVTIWGESAGAGSVVQHLVANGGNTQPPLFRAAMTSSTGMPSQYNYNDTIPEMIYSEVVNLANCRSSLDTLACLRSADIDTLQVVNHNMSAAGYHGTFFFVPVVDGTFIVERPTVTIAKRKLNGEAFLAVTNVNEGADFVDQSLSMNISEYVSTLFPNLRPWEVEEATELYANMGTNVEQANYVMGESIFVCPTYHLLLSKDYPHYAWKGEFAVPPALHADDVPYYFVSFGPTFDNADFIASFSGAFLSFAMFLNPGDKYDARDVKPTWDEWNVGHTEMVFNVTEAGTPNIYSSPTDGGLMKRCRYWQSVAPNTAQ